MRILRQSLRLLVALLLVSSHEEKIFEFELTLEFIFKDPVDHAIAAVVRFYEIKQWVLLVEFYYVREMTDILIYSLKHSTTFDS